MRKVIHEGQQRIYAGHRHGVVETGPHAADGAMSLEGFQSRRLGFDPNIVGKTVAGLERLATALYVTLEDENASVADRALKVHDLKKHVSVEDARIAIADVDAMIRDLPSSDPPE